MGTTGWISSAAAAAAIVTAGGFAYLNRDCETCIISSMLGAGETRTVAADAPAAKSGCCPLTESATVLAAEANTDIVMVDADAAVACDKACDAARTEACDEACEETCDESCEEPTQEVAASEGTESGNG